MISDDLTSTGVKIEHDNMKLVKVLSTKLSIDDYKVFRILTKEAYRHGAIKEDAPSEMLRYILIPVFEGFQKLPEFSTLKDKLY
jgi:hypothetical protein